MFTMKAGLIAASTIGAVAIGGVTWAATGQSGLGLPGGSPKAPVEAQKVQDALPAAPPTCLPKAGLPKVPDAKAPDLPNAPKAPDASKPNLPNVPSVPNAPKAPDAKPSNLPSVPNPNVPAVPKDVPGAPKDLPGAPKDVPGVPKDVPALPNCLPDTGSLPSGAPSNLPTNAPKPGLPKLPGAPKLSCDKLPAPVQIGGSIEKTLILPKGLQFASANHGSIELKSRKICAITQKWTGKAGQWLTVERLKVPAGITEQDLRKALKLPEKGGKKISLNGGLAWQSSAGTGVLLFDQEGYSLFVNGSPVMAGSVQDLTGALHRAH
ncbi:hypothetical protein [Actinomadura rudentiformis]|uniref:Uncharacterized protein n=1 Tax=Actinomadura rudentiformis TaxID=359158 RepID=A0A6H9Z976_9ACTN|nr:hypothetical protein [Actinomadura rudentiformis]KAB2350664.1 hypothetical protein F8566_06610 [Actinomadura rudentiformis]